MAMATSEGRYERVRLGLSSCVQLGWNRRTRIAAHDKTVVSLALSGFLFFFSAWLPLLQNSSGGISS